MCMNKGTKFDFHKLHFCVSDEAITTALSRYFHVTLIPNMTFGVCPHVKTHKLLQVCKQVVTNMFTSYQQVVLALLVPSGCNKFGTSC